MGARMVSAPPPPSAAERPAPAPAAPAPADTAALPPPAVEPAGVRLEIDISERELRVYENGKLAESHRVAVG